LLIYNLKCMIKTVKKDGKKETDKVYVSKRIEPGNQVARILEVKLVDGRLRQHENSYKLMYIMETEPVGGDFQGFPINKDDPGAGFYEGKVSWVSSAPYPFYTGKTKNGKLMDRDESILASIKTLCMQSNRYDWWKKANNKFNTIEEFVEGFNNDRPFANTWFYICIAGDEYYNKEGYKDWNLYLPYSRGGKYPFCPIDGDQSKVFEFDPNVHCKFAAEKPKGSDDDLDF